MADTGSKRIANMFRFKHHAIAVPEIMATNLMIDTTARLTAAIAGIHEATPNKMEAIHSLCTLPLSKVAPLPPPALSILPTPQDPSPLVNVDKPIIVWNPQLVQPSVPILSHNTNDIIPNHMAPAIVEDDSDNNLLIPITARAHLVTISCAHCKTVFSCAINCGYAPPI
jgi:hypothetical protein